MLSRRSKAKMKKSTAEAEAMSRQRAEPARLDGPARRRPSVDEPGDPHRHRRRRPGLRRLSATSSHPRPVPRHSTCSLRLSRSSIDSRGPGNRRTANDIILKMDTSIHRRGKPGSNRHPGAASDSTKTQSSAQGKTPLEALRLPQAQDERRHLPLWHSWPTPKPSKVRTKRALRGVTSHPAWLDSYSCHMSTPDQPLPDPQGRRYANLTADTRRRSLKHNPLPVASG